MATGHRLCVLRVYSGPSIVPLASSLMRSYQGHFQRCSTQVSHSYSLSSHSPSHLGGHGLSTFALTCCPALLLQSPSYERRMRATSHPVTAAIQ